MTTKAPDPADKALDAAADGQFAGGRPGTAEDALRRVRLGYDLRNREARALADYVATLEARATDNPDTDATDFAHPAWWRGEARGVDATCEALTRVLDQGKGAGVFGSDALEALAVRLEGLRGVAEQLRAARAANERDRTAWDVVFARLRGCVRRWAWVRTGRGPYEWDDDEYRKEFGRFADEITRIVARGEQTTHVHDWSNCPTTQAEVDAARQGIT